MALALLGQVALAVLHLRDPDLDQSAFVVLALIGVLAVSVLLLPVRPSRWPISPPRARGAGVLCLGLGLPAPLWLYYGQLPLGVAALAALPAFAGAVLAREKGRQQGLLGGGSHSSRPLVDAVTSVRR